MRHADLVAAVRRRLPGYARLFPNATGLAKQGERYVRHGLAVGSADLIGWTRYRWGNRAFGVFTAIELKGESELLRQEQLNFMREVAKVGALAVVIRSPDEVERIFSQECLMVVPGEKVYGERPGDIVNMWRTP